MGRHKEINQPAADMPEILPAVVARIEAAQDALAVQAVTAQALATQLGYEGGLSVGALEDGIRFYQQRTAEACLELGKRLVLLKEVSLHGEFKPRLELLGIEYTAASRFMAVAAKFSKVATSQLLKLASSQGKVIELLVLDSEEIAELAENGTVRGMAADDVANMGVRELRTALREARAEGSANQSILDKKNSTIDRLEREKKRIQAAPPNEVLADLQREATAIMNDALGAVRGGMRQALIALKNHGDEDHSLFMAGLVGQVQADLAALREEFNLPDVSNAADAQLAAEVAEWSGASNTVA
jgi:hypothetical protein